jgi:HK97 gp10 family phage protein
MVTVAKVQGLDALTAQFKRMREKVRVANAGALLENAEDLARRIKAAAPKDEHELEQTVRVVPGKNGVTQRVVAGGKATRRPVEHGQSPTFDYARAQEFGTEDLAANPFFFPVYRKRKRAMRAKQKRAIKKAIKEALT